MARRRGQPEYEMCKLFLQILERREPEIRRRIFHIANENTVKHHGHHAKRKCLGVRAGVADYFLPVARGSKHGLWLEAKVKPNRMSKAQKDFMTQMEEAGYATAVCYTVDEMLKTINNYIYGP